MTGLGRKLRRDLVSLRWQIASIALVVASGVAILVAALGAFRSLTLARDAFYARTRFPDVFVGLKRAPDPVARELARIDGVAGVETRLAFEVPLDLPGVSAPVVGRVISLSRAGQPARTRLIVVTGRLPRPGARREVAINEAFAGARDLSPGDKLPAILDGHREELTIVGLVLSSEYAAALPPGRHIPDDLHYGVLWLPYDAVASAYRAEGTYRRAGCEGARLGARGGGGTRERDRRPGPERCGVEEGRRRLPRRRADPGTASG